MAPKRIVAARMWNGHIGIVEQDVPAVTAGTVLVEVHASLVSPGTELGGWRALRQELDATPKDQEPSPFGYSNAGIVREVGEGVSELQPGDRVACMGWGYALHTDWAVIPHNLCVKLPQNVTFAQGSFAMLAATALHALRRGEPGFGEFAAIVGLGIVGQLAAQFYRLAGNYVIGWDVIPLRAEIAQDCGIDATALAGGEDVVARTNAFTGGAGLDSAVIAYGGQADKAMEQAIACMKLSPDTHRMGTIVVVGGPEFQYPAGTHNLDIRRAARTGPGYHDDAWEVGGPYPPVFMRWTTPTNLQLCMRLISEGRLKVDELVTHTIPLDNVDEEIAAMLDDPDGILGVVFEMQH